MSDPERDEQNLPFWERRETVERFAGRDPDQRLTELIEEFPDPSDARVLDLGCAGGRNTVLLAERGFDFLAVDASQAMVDETRRRVADVLGRPEAARRTREGRMDRLEGVRSGSVDLVVALGVYHAAQGRAEWDRALAETARVLRPGGRALVAVHTDECDLDGKGLVPIEGETHVYRRRSGRNFLVGAATLDREMARHGLLPIAATETVRRETDGGGLRVTANAF
ncbi:MAG: class I SAM-dependent methyltransferase, partial [Planctomycetota bacterium]